MVQEEMMCSIVSLRVPQILHLSIIIKIIIIIVKNTFSFWLLIKTVIDLPVVLTIL
jgi:hypothetical protein